MKALAAAGIALILTACTGETTVIREVQVTTPPNTTEITSPPVETEEPTRLSRDQAVAIARDSAPGLYAYSDEQIISMMMTSCEAIDSWAPDYDGYLRQARQVMADDTETMVEEITAIITTSIFSLCTEHQIGIMDALGESDAL